MQDSFEIPVTYKGKELSFKAEVQKLGYIYRIIVDVYGANVSFEQDEEGNYRGLLDTYDAAKFDIDIALVRAIGEVLEQQRNG